MYETRIKRTGNHIISVLSYHNSLSLSLQQLIIRAFKHRQDVQKERSATLQQNQIPNKARRHIIHLCIPKKESICSYFNNYLFFSNKKNPTVDVLMMSNVSIFLKPLF